MPLQQLVEYFNYRFEQEHRSNFHPLILQAGKVSGFFGPIRVGSEFTPVRSLSNSVGIVGHTVACSVMMHDFHDTQRVEIENSYYDWGESEVFAQLAGFDLIEGGNGKNFSEQKLPEDVYGSVLIPG